MTIHDEVLRACEGINPLPERFWPWGGSMAHLADPFVHDQRTVGPVIDEVVRIAGGKLGFNPSYMSSANDSRRRVTDLLASRATRSANIWQLVPTYQPIGNKWTHLGDLAHNLLPSSPWRDMREVTAYWDEQKNAAEYAFRCYRGVELLDHAPSESAWFAPASGDTDIDIAGRRIFWRMFLDADSIMFGTILGGSLPDYAGAPKYRSIDVYTDKDFDARVARLGMLIESQKPVLWIDPATFPDPSWLRTQARFNDVDVVTYPGPFYFDPADDDPYRSLHAYIDFVRRFHGKPAYDWPAWLKITIPAVTP